MLRDHGLVTDGLPARVRAWIEEHAPGRVAGIGSVDGGITRTKWIIRLTEGGPLVVRWADPQVWGETGREHVRREAYACRLLSGSGLPVPRLVASDPTGADAGGPANLMTWCPGRTRLDRTPTVAIDALAAMAVAIHQQSIPVEDRPPVFSYRCPAEPSIPTWATDPGLWGRAIMTWQAGPPATPYGLIHRDFHFGNVLWQGDRVTGLIDWAEISWGPADLDVAHLCADLAMLHTVGDARLFRDGYRRHGGRLDPDPDAGRFWMISDILGFLPDPAHILPGLVDRRPDLTPDVIRHRLEELLAETMDPSIGDRSMTQS